MFIMACQRFGGLMAMNDEKNSLRGSNGLMDMADQVGILRVGVHSSKYPLTG
jgi:hypothetical protein